MTLQANSTYGIALINKPVEKTSFFLVSFLRRLTSVRCIGHAGTLDPFATGVMVLLIGKPFTRLSNELISFDKEYKAKLKFGSATDSHDLDGEVTMTSDIIPTIAEIETVCEQFQGEVLQTPPMFSAKKVKGKKLYELARQGKVIERKSKKVTIKLEILSYEYPYLDIHVTCSSGTYIRTIADDIGQKLGCGAHLVELLRTRVGPFHLQECQECDELTDSSKLNLRQNW
ncbi:MAG: tRNA pseudouridine synthase B [Chlamydiae bacterium]|nr:tRNA pseudouridine synthase B [Chlamydiota bacterium]